MKKIIKKFFNRLGYSISKKDNLPKSLPSPSPFTMRNALKRAKKRGLEINTVIDVGSSDGRWSNECMNTYPDASYHLIEAQKDHENGLSAFAKENDNVSYTIAAAGEKVGAIYFNAEDLFGGVASIAPIDENSVKVPVTTIDYEVEKNKLQGPFLLKLDTHGFEVPILEGAKNTLKNANLVIIETYNFNIEPESLTYWKMCDYMDKLGFRSIEIVDLMLREHDNAFWQMDTFFIKKTDSAFLHLAYK